jgi:hypothetical protein
MNFPWISTTSSSAAEETPGPAKLQLVRPTGDRGAAVETHLRSGALDEPTLAAISGLIFRVTKRPLAASISLALWADEVVITRDAAGRIVGAHGFRFVDVPQREGGFRMICASFSIAESPAVAARTGALFGRILDRERNSHPTLSVVWVNAPSCDQVPVVSPDAAPIRRLVVSAGSRLPLNLRLFATGSVNPGTASQVPEEIDAAATALLRSQRELEHQARLGRVGPMPRSSVMSAATGMLRAG